MVLAHVRCARRQALAMVMMYMRSPRERVEGHQRPPRFPPSHHVGYDDPELFSWWASGCPVQNVGNSGEDRVVPVLVSRPASNGRRVCGSLGGSVLVKGGEDPLAVREALSSALGGQDGEVLTHVPDVQARQVCQLLGAR